jgi:SecD/SecF fusion protein
VHWKEREPVYRTRYRRIRESLGYVPAYAIATAGAPVDVDPDKRRRPAVSITAPQDPTAVSRGDFDDMVRNLGIDETKRKPAAAAAGRPAGGRRARARANGGTGPAPGTGGEGQGGTGAGGGEPPKPKKTRNKRHGRPR